MIFRTLINSFGGNIYNVTYINSKGSEVIVTNSSDINLYSIAPGTYRIKVGNYEHEYKFNLGGVYAVLEIPDPLTDFVSTNRIVNGYNINVSL